MRFNFPATARRTFLSTGLGGGLLVLSACGGGLSTAGDSLSIDSIVYSPTTPTSGVPVVAVASASYTGGITSDEISYAWTQTSGPSVSLAGSSSATVYFTSPAVSSSAELVLKLTLSANGVSTSKSVTIAVAP